MPPENAPDELIWTSLILIKLPSISSIPFHSWFNISKIVTVFGSTIILVLWTETEEPLLKKSNCVRPLNWAIVEVTVTESPMLTVPLKPLP